MSDVKGSNSDLLWAAVNRIVEPTTRRLLRDDTPVAVADTAAALKTQRRTGRLVPHDQDRYDAMTAKWATIPSLWDQATDALTTGNEAQEGRAKQPYRTPCDLDLMQTLHDIQDSLLESLTAVGTEPRAEARLQMRQLAAWVVTNRPEHVDWWTFRFEGWRRQLDHYLQAVLTQPKERRIRLTCPECGAKTVKITAPDGTKVNVPALVVDFNDGVMRAVECSNCAVTLAFRGEEMWTLAERIQDKETA